MRCQVIGARGVGTEQAASIVQDDAGVARHDAGTEPRVERLYEGDQVTVRVCGGQIDCVAGRSFRDGRVWSRGGRLANPRVFGPDLPPPVFGVCRRDESFESFVWNRVRVCQIGGPVAEGDGQRF